MTSAQLDKNRRYVPMRVKASDFQFLLQSFVHSIIYTEHTAFTLSLCSDRVGVKKEAV